MRIHQRWLLLLLLLSPSDRQAKNLMPRKQNCSAFEHASFMGNHILPKIHRWRSVRENFRMKACSVEMDAGQALKCGLSPHQPRLHKQVAPRGLPGHTPGLTNGQDPGGPRRFNSERPRAGGFVPGVCSAEPPGGKKNHGQHFRAPSLHHSLSGSQCGKKLLTVFCSSCVIFPTYTKVHKIQSI